MALNYALEIFVVDTKDVDNYACLDLDFETPLQCIHLVTDNGKKTMMNFDQNQNVIIQDELTKTGARSVDANASVKGSHQYHDHDPANPKESADLMSVTVKTTDVHLYDKDNDDNMPILSTENVIQNLVSSGSFSASPVSVKIL